MLEVWLTRGDRRMNDVVYGAWRRGSKFDAWNEHFDYDAWLAAFAEAGLSPSFYSHRERPLDEVLPWDHIDAALKKEFLAEDYRMSVLEETRVDCRDRCFACGILPKFKELRRENAGEVWECPEVNGPRPASAPVFFRPRRVPTPPSPVAGVPSSPASSPPAAPAVLTPACLDAS
jgi:hypothetical protein